ncbi:hypothetical protein [Komagataeibacter xylinus]|uniref:hypothetical protein n=1 Tax=Komagataeibacter xylinus TaxID=28448 RepID=UPI000B0B2607|nr:hypothetical protein [Komagataeibacter xylinus]
MDIKTVDQALPDAVVEVLEEDCWNYSLFLKSFSIEPYENRDSVETIKKIFGENVVVEDLRQIRTEDVSGIIDSSPYYAGDVGAGPSADSLSSREFHRAVHNVQVQVANIPQSATRVETFSFREGHPAYPVFWDFARKTSTNHKEVFGEAFFKKLRGMPPFGKKATSRNFRHFLSIVFLNQLPRQPEGWVPRVQTAWT